MQESTTTETARGSQHLYNGWISKQRRNTGKLKERPFNHLRAAVCYIYNMIRPLISLNYLAITTNRQPNDMRLTFYQGTHTHTQKEEQHGREKPQKCQTLNHYLNTKHSHRPNLPFFWGISEDLLKLYILQSRFFPLVVGGAVENSPTDCIVLTEVQCRQCIAKCAGVGEGGLWCELPFILVQWLREKGDQFVPSQSAATSLVTEIKALPRVEESSHCHTKKRNKTHPST